MRKVFARALHEMLDSGLVVLRQLTQPACVGSVSAGTLSTHAAARRHCLRVQVSRFMAVIMSWASCASLLEPQCLVEVQHKVMIEAKHCCRKKVRLLERCRVWSDSACAGM